MLRSFVPFHKDARCGIAEADAFYPGAAPCVLTYALLSEPGSKAAIDGPVRTGDERRCI